MTVQKEIERKKMALLEFVGEFGNGEGKYLSKI